jgi:hypothetical protein
MTTYTRRMWRAWIVAQMAMISAVRVLFVKDAGAINAGDLILSVRSVGVTLNMSVFFSGTVAGEGRSSTGALSLIQRPGIYKIDVTRIQITYQVMNTDTALLINSIM